MRKLSVINPPFWAIKEIGANFLKEFEEIVQEYKETLILEIEEEENDFEDTEINLEEELNERFHKTDLSQIMQDKLYDDEHYAYMRMPKIPLANKNAEDILYSTDIYIKAKDDGTRGSISFVGPLEVEMRLFPCAILDNTSGADFDDILDQFKYQLYATIRHELIHAIHFAYEHAEIKEHLVNTKEDEEFDDYDYYDDDDGIDQGFEYYKQHQYAPPGKKPKSLPWDSETNLKMNPRSDYYNNRFEREAHPSDLALETFDRLLKSKSKYTQEEINNYLLNLSQRSLGDSLMSTFRYFMVSKGFFSSQPYKILLNKENHKDFLRTAYKNLESIIDEYVKRNS